MAQFKKKNGNLSTFNLYKIKNSKATKAWSSINASANQTNSASLKTNNILKIEVINSCITWALTVNLDWTCAWKYSSTTFVAWKIKPKVILAGRKINDELVDLMRIDGVKSLSEIVGTGKASFK